MINRVITVNTGFIGLNLSVRRKSIVQRSHKKSGLVKESEIS